MVTTTQTNPVLLLSTLLVFWFVSSSSSLQPQTLSSSEIEAIIKMEKQGEKVIITGVCKNSGDQKRVLQYQLEILRTDDQNNRSTNSQDGEFEIGPNSSVDLSRSETNMGTNG